MEKIYSIVWTALLVSVPLVAAEQNFTPATVGQTAAVTPITHAQRAALIHSQNAAASVWAASLVDATENQQAVPVVDSALQQCFVCYEHKRLLSLYCEHSFCVDCLHQHIATGKRTCPMCRGPIYNAYITTIERIARIPALGLSVEVTSAAIVAAHTDHQLYRAIRPNNPELIVAYAPERHSQANRVRRLNGAAGFNFPYHPRGMNVIRHGFAQNNRQGLAIQQRSNSRPVEHLQRAVSPAGTTSVSASQQ